MAHVQVRSTVAALVVVAVVLSRMPAEAQEVDKPIPTPPTMVIKVNEAESRAQGPMVLGPAMMNGGVIQQAVAHELGRLKHSMPPMEARFMGAQTAAQKRTWGRRHPVILGALIGFGGGFFIGYAGGDDGVFDDFTAGFNGFVLGGTGAGAGAMVGAVVGAVAD